MKNHYPFSATRVPNVTLVAEKGSQTNFIKVTIYSRKK